MRIAYRVTGEQAGRALRVLQSEPDVDRIGVFEPTRTAGDERIREIGSLAGFDVLVTDSPRLLESAIEFRVPVVMPNEEVPELAPGFAASGIPLVLGANRKAGLAPSLARHEAMRFDELLAVTIGWTSRGSKRRRGEALPFPGPIGGLWAEEARGMGWPPNGATPRYLEAPLDSSYAGVVAKVSGYVDDGVVTTVIGSSDDRLFLDAICLAAAVAPAAGGSYPGGPTWPAAAAEAYLAAALAAGVDVATFTSRS